MIDLVLTVTSSQSDLIEALLGARALETDHFDKVNTPEGLARLIVSLNQALIPELLNLLKTYSAVPGIEVERDGVPLNVSSIAALRGDLQRLCG